jgi:thiamine transport system permease protein
MADGAQPLMPSRLTLMAGAAAAFVAFLTLGTLLVVIARAGGAGWPGAADWAALRFTVLQATLSAFLSVACAIPVARALARRRFPGRGIFITLLGAPFILPVIVAAMGILTIFGRSGALNGILGALGIEPLSVYGLKGVVFAHVFLNLPLAVRLILQGWLAIPAERFRLAAALGFGPRDIARHLERPMLREVVPGIAVTIFLICLTSFSVALTLGGGPKATTIELAIYQAFRFDFDLGRAAILAAMQLAICATTAALAARLSLPPAFGAGLDVAMQRWDAASPLARLADGLAIGLAALFLLAPLAAMIAAGLPGAFRLPLAVWQSALWSVAVTLAATTMALLLALPIALGSARLRRGRLLEVTGMLPLATSALVIGTGLFLILRPFASPTSLAMPVTVLVNAVMALPFCLRALIPATRQVEADYARLADSLGMTGLARLRYLTLPRLRRPLGFAAGLTAAMSMGDLGVIALFADPDRATLPLQLYRLMSAYRMEDAAGAAVLLMILSFGLFWLFDRGGRTYVAA